MNVSNMYLETFVPILDLQKTSESPCNKLSNTSFWWMIMLSPRALFMVLSYVHQSEQLGAVGKITQMTSASYKKIEVDEASWMKASLNETKTLLTDSWKGYVAQKVYRV